VLGVVEQQFKFFGLFLPSIQEVADPEALQVIMWIMKRIPKDKMTLFNRVKKEVSERDNVFVQKVMKLDWRDRPAAKEILEDEWWDDDEE